MGVDQVTWESASRLSDTAHLGLSWAGAGGGVVREEL